MGVKKAVFKGHCVDEGAENYLPFYGKREMKLDIYRPSPGASAAAALASNAADASHQSTTVTIAYAIAILECNPDDCPGKKRIYFALNKDIST